MNIPQGLRYGLNSNVASHGNSGRLASGYVFIISLVWFDRAYMPNLTFLHSLEFVYLVLKVTLVLALGLDPS